MKERKKFNKKLTGIAALSLAVVLAIGGSLAYFTDRETITASAVAGTVNIEMGNVHGSLGSRAENVDDKVLYDQDGKNILNPGDARGINWTTTETGNKSVDCRDTLVLTCDKAMSAKDADSPMQFELYKADDVTGYTKEAGYTLKEGAKPLTTRTVSAGNKTVTYVVDDVYTLNGNNGETETGIDSNSKDRGYVLVFRSDSDNTYQNAKVTVSTMVEAKQHRNTGSDWTTIAKKTFSLGGQDVQAVPAANE